LLQSDAQNTILKVDSFLRTHTDRHTCRSSINEYDTHGENGNRVHKFSQRTSEEEINWET